MELVRFKARALLSACFALVVVAYAAAQAPESESGAAAASSEQARLGEMFYRVQVLEQEVRELRGLLEEQAFQLERLSRQQKEHYIDLDGRLATLGGEVPGAATGSATTPREASRAGGLPRPERDAYSAAFDLMKEQRYQESSDAFNRLIADYPNGEYTPNAFYWLGELHLAMGEAEQARQWFAQVLALYPNHAKAADASYKLGVVNSRLNDNERAVLYLNRVISEHPNSPAAGLAQDFLQELE